MQNATVFVGVNAWLCSVQRAVPVKLIGKEEIQHVFKACV